MCHREGFRQPVHQNSGTPHVAPPAYAPRGLQNEYLRSGAFWRIYEVISSVVLRLRRASLPSPPFGSLNTGSHENSPTDSSRAAGNRPSSARRVIASSSSFCSASHSSIILVSISRFCRRPWFPRNEKLRLYGKFVDDLIHAAMKAGEIDPTLNRSALRMLIIGAANYTPEWYHRSGPLSVDDISDLLIRVMVSGVGIIQGNSVKKSLT